MAPETRNTSTSAKAGALVALTGNSTSQVIIASDKVTAVVTPKTNRTKSKRSQRPPRYFTFILKGGLPDEHIVGKDEAYAFKRDNPDMIIDHKAYSSLVHWDKFKKRRALEYGTRITVPSAANNNDDDADTKLMLQKMSGSIQVETFQGYFRTNGRASKFVLFIHFISNQGDDAWCWKPKLMVPALVAYFEVRPPTDSVMRDAFATLAYGPRPNKENKAKQLCRSFTPPNNNGKTVEIPIFTTYAVFQIPVDTISSTQEETKWIHTYSVDFIEAIRSAMGTNSFKSMLIAMDDRFTDKVFDPKKGANLPKFLAKAIVRVDPIVNMASQVMGEDAVELSSLLYRSRLPAPKYGNPNLNDNQDDVQVTNGLNADLEAEVEDDDMSDEGDNHSDEGDDNSEA